MINILADQHLYNIQSYLPESTNLRLFDPASDLPPELDTAHALLTRTVTRLNEQTLPIIPDNLEFVGTGSAGTDHVDLDYLSKNNINFADAAGCNARSVAEYVITTLLIWTDNTNHKLSDFTVGIIGVGKVGTQVIKQLTKLGISTVSYDPPREDRDKDYTSASIDEVLSCPVLTFHTPLVTGDSYPTYHWLDEQKLSKHRYEIVINTARGGVVDEQSLLSSAQKGTVKDFIIDVWESEPNFNIETAYYSFIKTPHIAGYSVQAKENASKFIADALLEHFDISPPNQNRPTNPAIFTNDISEFDSLSSLLKKLHPLKRYEKELEHIIRNHPSERGTYFNKLRAEFPLRQEFAEIHLPASYFERFPVLKKLGFSLLRNESK